MELSGVVDSSSILFALNHHKAASKIFAVNIFDKQISFSNESQNKKFLRAITNILIFCSVRLLSICYRPVVAKIPQ